MRKIKWPENHKFAFTIVDDTDGATIDNIKPVYDYLYKKGIITTKTCWAFPPRDEIYRGQCLEDDDYKSFLIDLQKKGYEIGFHNAGSGGFKREETLEALEIFKNAFGDYPKMHINHSNNVENIYWGCERFSPIISKIYRTLRKNVKSLGTDEKSEYFWGDISKKHFKYIRNRTFKEINTLKADPRFVYPESKKQKYSNFWFSSSDGMRLSSFLKLLSRKSVDKLISENGCCIVYTHFGYDFVDEKGNLSEEFKDCIDYIASKNGWFAPASEILDYVLENKSYKPSKLYETYQDFHWFFERVMK